MLTHFPHSRVGSISKKSLVVGTSPYRTNHDAPHWPPSSTLHIETQEDVEVRQQKEKAARLLSESIDRAIAAERAKRKKAQPVVRILLLGQAESGKSTTLKNFQLHFTPRAFHADAEAWRIVIYMNLIRSVNSILELLDADPDKISKNRTPSYTSLFPPVRQERTDRQEVTTPLSPPPRPSQTNGQRRPRTADGSFARGGLASPPPFGHSSPHLPPAHSHELRRLKLSLLPLKNVEATLNQFLETVPAAPIRPPESYSLEISISPKKQSSLFQTDVGADEALVADLPQLLKSAGSSQSISSDSTLSLKSSKSLKCRLTRRHSVAPPSRTSTEERSSFEKSARSPTTEPPSKPLAPPPDPLPSPTRITDILSSSLRRPPLVFKQGHDQVHLELAVRVRGNSTWKRVARTFGVSALVGGKRDVVRQVADQSSIISFDGSVAGQELTDRDFREFSAARQVIEACADDMKKLWANGEVRDLLRRHGIHLEEQPGFFLDDIERITAPNYVPATNDILRARLSTIGVVEHRLKMESGAESGQEWVFYDVGGTRPQRAAWAPFFDNVTAIIFLAPLSAFNEKLAEDPTINRLEDTYQLWKTICSNKLLASVQFILFMNKYDILVSKLRSGVRFERYVTRFKSDDKPLDSPEKVAKYMLAMFHTAHKKTSPKPRKLHAYLTSVIDTKETLKVLYHIREQVIVGHLHESKLV
ncbi:G-alpha-domain-containing protein [Schizopora paradoxa]|uniref:G-alpha-domain-containing protein n=1 Tax=Schizopora paradoxa TaxID=27342 RepID=A0A0H2RWX5_9AGAM|nr:G-alpha-domain-containing protein [Schizopora paradoxa]